MKHTEETLIGFEGCELFFQSWKPEGEPKAVIAILHGGFEHSGHYKPLVSSLLERGFALAGLDLRGHGRSQGKRGHITDFNEIREDTGFYLARVQKEFPGKPLFLFGHSLGASIALDYPLRRSAALSGVILSGAGISTGNINRALLAFFMVFSAFFPSLKLKMNFEFSAVTRDPKAVEEYEGDPLILSALSVGFYAEFLKTIAWVRDHASEWELPLLMLHGSEDQNMPVEDAREFFGYVGCEDKELITYEGGYHCPYNDLQKEQVFSDIEKWIDKHLSS